MNSTLINTTNNQLHCFSLFGKTTQTLTYDTSLSSSIQYKTIASVIIITMIPTIALNITLLVALITLKELKTVSNTPLAFLAGWNLLGAMFNQPLFVSYLFQTSDERLNCGVLLALIYGSPTITMMSAFTVVVIATERYVALYHTYYWSEKVTRQKLTWLLSLIWLPPCALCLLMFESSLEVIGVGIYTFFTFLSLAWISFAYFRMYCLIRKMQLQLESQERAASSENEAKQRKQARLSRFSIAIIAVYLIFDIPYSIASVVLHAIVKKDDKPHPVEAYMHAWIMAIALVEPLVYAWQSPIVARGMRKVWRRGRSGTEVEELNGQHHRFEGVIKNNKVGNKNEGFFASM